MSHYMKPGVSQRSRIKIMTVDPSTRRVEGMMKDGSMLQIAVWDVPTAFRWPKENEIWVVQQESGIWKLSARIQDGQVSAVTTTDSGQATSAATPEAAPIESLSPGTLKLDGQIVVDDQGNTFIAVDLTGIADGWTIHWDGTLNQWIAGP